MNAAIKQYKMRNSKLLELVERAECYFDEELIRASKQSDGWLLVFEDANYANQFIRESKKVKRGMIFL